MDDRIVTPYRIHVAERDAHRENILRNQIQAILQQHRKNTRAKINELVKLIEWERVR